MRRMHLLFLIALLCLPLQLRAQISEGFESGIPGTWIFSGPAGLDGVAGASSGIIPPQGTQFAWISTGCLFPSGGTTCPAVATTSTPTYSSLGLGSGSTLGSPTVEATLTSPVFSLASVDTVSFDANFVTTDGTNAFADFAVVQLVPISPSGTPTNLFVANTTCATCAAVPPVGLTNGVATLTPSTAFFAGLPVTLGSVAGTVSTNGTNGTAVTLVSGPQFSIDGGWTGTPITINGVIYTVSSVTSSTSLTLTTPAPAQSAVPYAHDTTYGSIPKFGGGPGGAAGWIHVSFSAPATGTYKLMFLVSHVGDTIYPSALAIDNVQTSFTTPPQTVSPGATVTFTDTPSPNNTLTVSIPADATMNGAASMEVVFTQVSPVVFNSTRLPATSTNTWSGGTAVPNGTTCTGIPTLGGNCLVEEGKCFSGTNGTGTLLATCPIMAGATDLILLTSHYPLPSLQNSPLIAIADDGANNWANITISASTDCCTLLGGTKGTQMDLFDGSLPAGSLHYASGGVCFGDVGHQILQPINADGSSVFKQGRTVPAKFRVCDVNGIPVGTPGVVSSFFLTAIKTGTSTTTVTDVVDTSNPDTAFRFDTTNQQWIFNITTANLVAGNTYIYTIKLNDGSTIMFQYGLQ